MPHPDQSGDRRDAINKLAADANLSDVAEWLNLRVVGRGTRSPKILCPFHDDQRPSMHLYPASGGGRSQFHCFSCGAHGDVFDLVKRQLNVDFRTALEWLADRYRLTLPPIVGPIRDDRRSNRVRGLELGLRIYRKQTKLEADELKTWAITRKVEFPVLKDAEIFAAFPPKISASHFAAEREQLDDLEAAGLLLRETMTRPGETARLPFEPLPRDFYNSPRILFTIRDDRGAITGFAGRAIGKDLPKYLFSPGFPRGDTLYRLHKVRAARPSRGSKGAKAIVHLFVVEGFMDALRLEAIGLRAVAILGNQISARQVGLLGDYARDLDRDHHQLAVHLLLDPDEAGRRGAVNATVKLLDASVDVPGLVLDLVMPPAQAAGEEMHGHDPDELLSEVKDAEAALALLSGWCYAPLTILLATALDVAPAELDSTWKELPEGQRLQAFRDVERRLDRARWTEILNRVPAFESHLLASSGETSGWQEPLRRFLRASGGRTTAPAVLRTATEKDDDGRLIRALQIAEASTQRREFPIDEGSWDRLQAAIDVTIPHLHALLQVADDRGSLDADPMLSVLVPKGGGKFRLKALPSPEILSLQQYVLNELLRDHADCPRFRRFIPGVRFMASSGNRRLETTGAEHLVPVGGETVSFAYTLDMDVIEHRAPPQRTGMFRSYFDCWRDFIGFIDACVAAFPAGRFHVARLDVRSFYDTVTRAAVNAVLLPSVKDALAELADSSDAKDTLACARLFLPKFKEPVERARALVDWLCDQSFNYKFENPGSVDAPKRPNGLPQGPDLSAYLANISLFPLDRALSELVARLNRQASEEQGETIREGQTSGVRGAVYARYVDDMVIIARTGHGLARLRATIEQQLALVGMELNPKTDPLPVMDEAGVREWLTDRRGAGLGVSGPFEGPPANTPLTVLKPLADAGETDRSDSLRILHDPRLDDPETSADELENAVEIILAAPESDLRHSDKAGAARHLWRCVIQGEIANARSAAEIVADFVQRWPQNDLHQRAKKKGSVSDLLAWLDGVERFLTSRPDRNPAFSEQKHRVLSDQRKRMAELVHTGLCEFLIERVPSVARPSKFDKMLELKTLVIHRAATLVHKPAAQLPIRMEAGDSRAKARLLISLAEAQASPALLDSAGWRMDATAIGILFHEAVARLRIANQQSALGVDPLIPLRQSMVIRGQGGHGSQLLEKVLHLWIPDGSAIDDPLAAEIALSALVNLTPQFTIDLIDKRTALKRFAIVGSDGLGLRLLPTPPGLNVPGLLGLRDDDRVVVRADFRTEINKPFCPQLSWTDNDGTPDPTWKRYEAGLGAYQYLPPNPEGVSHPAITLWLAHAFRSLVNTAARNDRTLSCPPTASNLLGLAIGPETAESNWEVLGFCVPAAKVSAQAFLRQGNGGLVLEPVLELYDHLWRVGTALADWLGRAHSTRQLSSQRLAAPALVEGEGEDWAREAMLRFSLCRLRGKALPARPLRLSPQTGLPMTVERVLKRLETFPSGSAHATGYAGVAHLFATLAEGRAIQTRINARIDPATPGGATALLAEMARGQFRADEELALRLPDSEMNLAAWAPQRRPARSLFALAERLTMLAELDPMHAHDRTLIAIASGTRLLSLELQLRSQALELWSLLDPAAQLKFKESPPSLAEWNLDTSALLHREQPSPLREISAPETSRNVHVLFQKLLQATTEDHRVDWGAIAGITPLGWMVVLGALTGSLTGDWRGGFVDAEQFSADDRARFNALASQISLAGADGNDLPWGGLEDVIGAWDSMRFQEALTTLGRLDAAAGLRVAQQYGPRFYIATSRGRSAEVETSDGRRRLPSWAIAWAKATNEIRDGVERVSTPIGEQRAIFRWSETWRGDHLVGIGVVQPGMVALAGRAFVEAEPSSKVVSPVSSFEPSLPPESHEPSDGVGPVAPPAAEPSPQATAATAATAPSAPGAAEQPLPAEVRDISEDEICAALFELEQMQQKSWESRREKPQSHVRIALFQWDADETYRHPGFDMCDHANSPFDRRKPESWIDHAYGRSCAEFRRRVLLKAVLKACHRFDVEILLLPEYSTRPETVGWLSQEAPTLAPKTSVWAGTYRLPPGMQQSPEFPPWSAVHEVILANHTDRRLARAKKYPATAADEVFYPGGPEMAPLFADQKIDDVRSYIYELICSEVFLVTSPANLRPLARVRRELLRKFNAGMQGKDLDDAIRDDVMADIEHFARYTALGEGLGIRRTILLVPAMTSRSADYSVLGQAGFLASGLTTVFCNAVCHPYGHGQSCFVGHDGWIDEKEASGFPTFEPYHGARPGIFHLNHWNRGRLGKNEQALVIADIDPIYGPEGKPRPQTLLKPLRLVAHLPAIEAWQPIPRPLQGACRCRRMHRSMDAGDFAPYLHSALMRGIGSWQTTMDDPAPNILANALERLAESTGLPYGTDESGRGWLMQRKKAYLAHHLADPNPWPPPIALDWLWVDAGNATVDGLPEIEVPPYTNPPGGESSER